MVSETISLKKTIDHLDKGGASEEEVGAALFMYSPTALAQPKGDVTSVSAEQRQAMAKSKRVSRID